MTETPKVGLKLKFYENLIVSPFLNKSLPPGVQAKRKKLWGQICPPWGLERSKISDRVKFTCTWV